MKLVPPQGWQALHFKSIGSTNEFLAQYEDDCPMFVIADIQTGGRGRLGRKWESPLGGLYISYCVPWSGREDAIGWVPLLTGLCARRALARHGVDAVLKWPNDVIFNGKKLAGILSQYHGTGGKGKIVAGIGINVNNDPPLDTATSVRSVIGKDADIEELARDFMHEVGTLFCIADGDFDPMKKEYTAACATIGRPVRVDTPAGLVEGKAIRIDPDGALVLEGERRVLAGDCVHLKCSGSAVC